MSLETGTRLGPYEISNPIASGGMGDVYRARDRRLGRDVAVKVLPAAMAGDFDRQARFEREARVVSGTRLFAAAISGTGASVTVGEAREIMNIPRLRGRVEPLPDGSFIALQVPPDVGTLTELRLVVNWFDELRRLAPPK